MSLAGIEVTPNFFIEENKNESFFQQIMKKFYESEPIDQEKIDKIMKILCLTEFNPEILKEIFDEILRAVEINDIDTLKKLKNTNSDLDLKKLSWVNVLKILGEIYEVKLKGQITKSELRNKMLFIIDNIGVFKYQKKLLIYLINLSEITKEELDKISSSFNYFIKIMRMNFIKESEDIFFKLINKLEKELAPKEKIEELCNPNLLCTDDFRLDEFINFLKDDSEGNLYKIIRDEIIESFFQQYSVRDFNYVTDGFLILKDDENNQETSNLSNILNRVSQANGTDGLVILNYFENISIKDINLLKQINFDKLNFSFVYHFIFQPLSNGNIDIQFVIDLFKNEQFLENLKKVKNIKNYYWVELHDKNSTNIKNFLNHWKNKMESEYFFDFVKIFFAKQYLSFEFFFDLIKNKEKEIVFGEFLSKFGKKILIPLYEELIYYEEYKPDRAQPEQKKTYKYIKVFFDFLEKYYYSNEKKFSNDFDFEDKSDNIRKIVNKFAIKDKGLINNSEEKEISNLYLPYLFFISKEDMGKLILLADSNNESFESDLFLVIESLFYIKEIEHDKITKYDKFLPDSDYKYRFLRLLNEIGKLHYNSPDQINWFLKFFFDLPVNHIEKFYYISRFDLLKLTNKFFHKTNFIEDQLERAIFFVDLFNLSFLNDEKIEILKINNIYEIMDFFKEEDNEFFIGLLKIEDCAVFKGVIDKIINDNKERDAIINMIKYIDEKFVVSSKLNNVDYEHLSDNNNKIIK